jgi:hypothetical protein
MYQQVNQCCDHHKKTNRFISLQTKELLSLFSNQSEVEKFCQRVEINQTEAKILLNDTIYNGVNKSLADFQNLTTTLERLKAGCISAGVGLEVISVLLGCVLSLHCVYWFDRLS